MTSERSHGKDAHENQQAKPRKDLDSALDALQGILEHRHVVPDQPPTELDPPPLPFSRSSQDTLPLLDEVVIPGGLLDAETDGFQGDKPASEPLEEMPPYSDLLSRLASELEIIIENCVDEALSQAKQDLMVQIKNHLDIVLPEILYQLTRRNSAD